jgi:hypothetical protein
MAHPTPPHPEHPDDNTPDDHPETSPEETTPAPGEEPSAHATDDHSTDTDASTMDDTARTDTRDESTATDEETDEEKAARSREIMKFLDAIREAIDEKQQELKQADSQSDADAAPAETGDDAPSKDDDTSTENAPADFRSRFADTIPQYKRDGLSTADQGSYGDRFARDNYRDRVNSGKYRGYFRPNTAQRETAQDIYLIRSTAHGFLKVWYYVRVSPRKKVMFLHDLKQGTVKIENYGEILKKGFGKYPDEEAIEYMEREHGYITRRTWEEE